MKNAILLSTLVCSILWQTSMSAFDSTSVRKSDREMNTLRISKGNSSGNVVLPHKLQPPGIQAGTRHVDSLFITKKMISQTIFNLENDQTSKALYTIYEALTFCSTKDIRTYAIANSYYALIQIHVGCHYKAVNSLNLCDSLYRKLGDLSLLAFHYNILGAFNQRFSTEKNAEKFFLQALALCRAIGDQTDITATALNNLSKGDGNAAVKTVYLREAISINKRLGKKSALADNYNNIAYQYISMHNYDKANAYLDSAIIIAKKIDAKRVLYNNYDIKARLYATQGRYESAYQATQIRQDINKSILDAQNTSDIEQLISNKLLTKKQYEINLQKKENHIRRLNFILLIAVSLFVIAILLFYYIYHYINNRRKMQTMELRQASAERDVKYTQAELLNLASYLNTRNEILHFIQISLNKAQKSNEKDVYSELRRINLYIKNLQTKNDDIESVMNRISKINENFIQRLSELHPDLTKNDKNIALLLRANLTTKQISTLMECSPKSVNMARYRMRIHLNMANDTNLVSYLKSIQL